MNNRIYDTNWILNDVYERVPGSSGLKGQMDSNLIFNFIYDPTSPGLRISRIFGLKSIHLDDMPTTLIADKYLKVKSDATGYELVDLEGSKKAVIYLTYDGTTGTPTGTDGVTLSSPGNWTVTEFNAVYFIDDNGGNITITIPDADATNKGKSMIFSKPRLVTSANIITIKTVSNQDIAQTSTFILRVPNDRAEIISVPFSGNGSLVYKYRVVMINREIPTIIKVSVDGSTVFSTIKSAVDYVNQFSEGFIQIDVAPGDYLITEPIVITAPNIVIKGDSVATTNLFSDIAIKDDSIFTFNKDFELSNMSINGGITTTGGTVSNIATNIIGFTSDKALNFGHPRNLIYNTSAYAQWYTNVVGYPIAINYNDGSAYTVRSYKMKAMNTSGSRMMKDWTLYAKLGAGAWVLLDTQTGIIWNPGEEKEYSITSPSSYDQYEFRVTAASHSTRLEINDIGLFTGAGTSMLKCENAIASSGGSYCEIQNVVLNEFKKGICFKEPGTEMWLFNSIIENCDVGVCNTAGSSFGIAEMTFSNNGISIGYQTGTNERHSVQNSIFIVNTGQIGLKWIATSNTIEYFTIEGNTFIGEGTYLDGFDFTATTDNKIFISGNNGVQVDTKEVVIGYSGTTITGLTQSFYFAPEKETTITYDTGVITEINSTQGDVSKQIIINYDIDGNITSIEKNIT